MKRYSNAVESTIAAFRRRDDSKYNLGFRRSMKISYDLGQYEWNQEKLRLAELLHLRKFENKYPYQALDPLQKEIRVLHLIPGPAREIVRGKLRHISLLSDPRPVFETISYTWMGSTGAKYDPCAIELDGTRVWVPFNTAQALRRFRYTEVERVVWIDAVCISQKDVGERNQQVALMGEVYRLGSHNLIYLEDDEIGEDLRVLRNMESVLAQASNETDEFRNLRYTVFRGGQFQLSTTAIYHAHAYPDRNHSI